MALGLQGEKLFLLEQIQHEREGLRSEANNFICWGMHLAWALRDDIYRLYDDIYTFSYLTHGLVMEIWERWISQVLGLLPL